MSDDVYESEIAGDGGAVSALALDTMTRAEIDVQIATAKRYPRSIDRFLKTAETMATLSVEIAESCFYALSRQGKRIEGPSVRLAEICATAYGNLRYGARMVGEDKRFVTAQGVTHDLENNNACTVEVKRRITNRNGETYNDDMIGVTSAAAASIALRNAILRVVPRSYVEKILVAAKKVAIGDASTLVDRRARALDWFRKAGVTDERLLAKLAKPSIEDLDLADLELMTGMRTAIKDGMTSLDEQFPPVPTVANPDAPPTPTSKASAMAAALGGGKKKD